MTAPSPSAEELARECARLRERVARLEEELKKRKTGIFPTLPDPDSPRFREKISDLRRSEVRQRSLADASFEAIFISENGICLDQNKTAETMFGYTLEEALGRHGTEWIHPGDRDIVARHMMEGLIQPYQVTALRKDGTTFPAEIQARMLDLDGRRVRITALRDISERKQTEDALRESENRFRKLAEMLPVTVYEINTEGRITFVNRRAFKDFGYSLEDFEGGLNVNSMLCPEDRERGLNNIRRIMKGEQIGMQEYTVLRKDGTRIPVLIRSAPMYRDGRIEGIHGVMLNIEERKKLEEQIQQFQKVDAIGRLAGGVAHDLNNLLTPILGFTEILAAGFPENDPNRERLRQIHASAANARNLTHQLLAFGRKQALEMKVIDLNHVLANFSKMLRRIIHENIDIRTLYGTKISPVRADRGQLEQVVLNLAINAQDAMPGGGVLEIRTDEVFLDETFTYSFPDLLPGKYVLLAVSDDGSGMDPDTRKQIFEPFFTTKERGKGTGLGLSTVYGIVKQHNAHIQVQSETGKGSTFKVYFPTSGALPEEAEPNRPFPEDSLCGNETIMVVEDNREVRDLSAALLECLGYRVMVAASADSCLKQVAPEDVAVDLLLADVMMPKMSGYELHGKMEKAGKKHKVLYISGYPDDLISRQGIDLEKTPILKKPFSMQELGKMVREVLDS